MGRVDIGRVGIWTRDLDQMPSSQAAEFVAEAAELGYGAVWLPEILGRDPFVTAARLLERIDGIKVATGIANIYARDPLTMANTQRTSRGEPPTRSRPACRSISTRADHVCVQVLVRDPADLVDGWRTLAPALLD